MNEQEIHEKWMRSAIEEAEKAEKLSEVPIGAIVVLKDKIIGRGYNLRETTQDATTHAEIIAIQQACKKVGSWRLEKAKLYVTLEPCPMCSGAMILSRISEVYFGAFDPKSGAAGTLMNLLEDSRFNHTISVKHGILENTCGEMISNFFFNLRSRKKKTKKG